MYLPITECETSYTLMPNIAAKLGLNGSALIGKSQRSLILDTPGI